MEGVHAHAGGDELRIGKDRPGSVNEKKREEKSENRLKYEVESDYLGVHAEGGKMKYKKKLAHTPYFVCAI